MNFTALDARIRSFRAEMIAFTSELVAIPSENPPGHAYADCVRVIESRLPALGLPRENRDVRTRKRHPRSFRPGRRDERRRQRTTNVVLLRALRRGEGQLTRG